MYTLDDYDYQLPETLIAQRPAAERDRSRLLHLNRDRGTVSHRHFHDVVDLLRPSDLLVVNNTRVVPGRLFLLQLLSHFWHRLARPHRAFQSR